MKKLFYILLSVYIGIICYQKVSAYSTYSYHIINKSALFAWGDRLQGTSTCKTAWQNALSDWYNASGVYIYNSSSSSSTLNTFNQTSSTLYGQTTFTLNGNKIETFAAKLNVGNTSIYNANVARSTANHEIGHLLGLNDISSGIAIMNTSRNRQNTYVPKSDDINGVRSVYGW